MKNKFNSEWFDWYFSWFFCGDSSDYGSFEFWNSIDVAAMHRFDFEYNTYIKTK